jgi:hypothetical protein
LSTEARVDPTLVENFVAQAHADLDRVRDLLRGEPALVNAAWDWGGGDWETALGAAAHMGRRDIALFLIAEGARMDVFAAAMLGELAIVRSIVELHPEVRDARGPHGIPLIMHAEAGGDHAAAVLEYLREALD